MLRRAALTPGLTHREFLLKSFQRHQSQANYAAAPTADPDFFPQNRQESHCDCRTYPPKSGVRSDTILNNIQLISDHKIRGDMLDITWKSGEQTSFPLNAANNTDMGTPETMIRFWNRDIMQEVDGCPTVQYENFTQNASGLRQHLSNLMIYGISCVQGTPPTLEATQHIAERTGMIEKIASAPLMWRIRTGVMENNDTSYSDKLLQPHTDICFYSQTEVFQIFHCLETAGEGGENTFTDGFWCAEELKKGHPSAFDTLTKHKLCYVYEDEKGHSYSLKPMIEIDKSGRVNKLRYNQSRVGPLQINNGTDVREIYASIRQFSKIIRNPHNQIQFQLKPGDVICVDNRRVMHGRTGFKGKRIMAGCYINREHVTSKYASVKYI